MKQGPSCISFCPLWILYNSKNHFNDNIFENKCCHCNEGSLYCCYTLYILQTIVVINNSVPDLRRHGLNTPQNAHSVYRRSFAVFWSIVLQSSHSIQTPKCLYGSCPRDNH